MTKELYQSADYTKYLGKYIREKREWAGMTIENLAEKAGISTNHIGNIELGPTVPSVRVFHAICDVLNISPTDALDAVKERVGEVSIGD